MSPVMLTVARQLKNTARNAMNKQKQNTIDAHVWLVNRNYNGIICSYDFPLDWTFRYSDDVLFTVPEAFDFKDR
jgi:hypothetical protein